MMKKVLSIFDFDQTLFRSPYPPPGYSNYSWWNSPESLMPPHIPFEPDNTWFREDIVDAFQQSLANEDEHTIICTGRLEPLREAVTFLVHMVGYPEEIHLNDIVPVEANTKHEKLKTEEYKINVMLDFLKRHPSVEYVHFWDDRLKSLQRYESVASMYGVEFFPHHVIEEKMESLICHENPDLSQ